MWLSFMFSYMHFTITHCSISWKFSFSIWYIILHAMCNNAVFICIFILFICSIFNKYNFSFVFFAYFSLPKFVDISFFFVICNKFVIHLFFLYICFGCFVCLLFESFPQKKSYSWLTRNGKLGGEILCIYVCAL